MRTKSSVVTLGGWLGVALAARGDWAPPGDGSHEHFEPDSQDRARSIASRGALVRAPRPHSH